MPIESESEQGSECGPNFLSGSQSIAVKTHCESPPITYVKKTFNWCHVSSIYEV